MRRLLVVATMGMMGSPLAVAQTCESLDQKSVAALFDDWNFALSSLDASKMVQRYWPNAVLLPTVSNTPRTNAAMIGDYFEHFLAKRPRGRIDTRTIQGGCNLAMDMGTYTFSLMDDKGVTSEVAARYTFIYQYRDGAWKILHHHSSAMPESGVSAAPAELHAAVSKPVAHTPKASPKGSPRTSLRAEVHGSAKDAKAVPPPPVDERTPMFANLASSPAPSKFYPPEAAKLKARGSVNLRVCADGSGIVSGSPEVLKSSGSKLLDEAARAWARAAKWVPATLNSSRVEGCTQVDVAFEPVV